MTPNKRDLKAYVRYDGTGKIVPGSLVLRRNKPKNGKWMEITAYECCTSFTSSTTTSTTTVNYVCTTLRTASQFSVLGASTVTNTGPTVVIGDLGLFPGTSITGFPPGVIIGTKHQTDTAASDAQIDATAAFVGLNAFSPDVTIANDIGGTVVFPGIYDFASSLSITGTVVLNGDGNPDALFIFQIPTTFIPAVGSVITLTNGAQAGNIYWAVGSSATLSVGSTVKGNIIAQDSITLNTNASLEGRAFALTGAVTMDSNNITNVQCTINPF